MDIVSKFLLLLVVDKNKRFNSRPFLITLFVLVIYLFSTFLFHDIRFRIAIPLFWGGMLLYMDRNRMLLQGILFYLVAILFFVTDAITFGSLHSAHQISYTVMNVALLLVLCMGNKCSGPIKHYIAFIVIFVEYILVLVAMGYLDYYVLYSVPVTADVLLAMVQTNLLEASEYAKDQISIYFIIPFLLISTYFIFLIKKNERIEAKVSRLDFLLLLFSLMLFGVVYFQNARLLNISKFIAGYQKEVAAFKRMKEALSNNKETFTAYKAPSRTNETYVVVIGESLNKYHMEIYGYPRHTTPKQKRILQDEGAIRFDAVYSNHTHTVPTLQYALTDANQQNKKKLLDSVSLLDVFKKAGFETYWLTNQALYGSWDTPLSVIGTSADHVISLNKSYGEKIRTQRYDEDLIPFFDEVLKKTSHKNRVIFIHLMGNHGSYRDRYPVSAAYFKDELPAKLFGSTRSEKCVVRITGYDNSVRYNDKVVMDLFELFQKDTVNTSAAFLYLSDHADDVVQGRRHDSGRFTYDMTQIPFWMWFSPDYRKDYREIFTCLSGNKKKLYSNDFLFDTMLGITNLKSDHYNAYGDISRKDYLLPASMAKTVHGTVAYANIKNSFFWLPANVNAMKARYKHVGVQEVTTIGKLKEALWLGCSSVVIPVTYENEKIWIWGSKNTVALTDLLSSDFFELEKIVLQVKNTTGSNNDSFFIELNEINKKNYFREKVIVELELPTEDISFGFGAGWTIAYNIDSLFLQKKKSSLSGVRKKLNKQTVRTVAVSRKNFSLLDKLVSQSVKKDFLVLLYEDKVLSAPHLVDSVMATEESGYLTVDCRYFDYPSRFSF